MNLLTHQNITTNEKTNDQNESSNVGARLAVTRMFRRALLHYYYNCGVQNDEEKDWSGRHDYRVKISVIKREVNLN
jgi:hypothetical protein